MIGILVVNGLTTLMLSAALIHFFNCRFITYKDMLGRYHADRLAKKL